MKRRAFLKLGSIPLLSAETLGISPVTWAASNVKLEKRVRPGDSGWPAPSKWSALNANLEGRLSSVSKPLDACKETTTTRRCEAVTENLKNPYFFRDQAGATQFWGWAGAWQSQPSAYAIKARDAKDISDAVNFARENNLRVVVKGAGHSYHGNSTSVDSLLIWTREMTDIVVHEDFAGNWPSEASSGPAVSVGAGAVWMDVYDAVTTRGGRYVQGGGCATVGVAGLVQSGGFGSFSKKYGLAAAGLLEAEVVTADGAIRTVNRYRNPELYWALRGGGGGFGVVTRLTFATHDLPVNFGDVSLTMRASTDTAFRALIEKFISFYANRLFNEHWGESVRLRPSNELEVSMVFQGVPREQVANLWSSFIAEANAIPNVSPKSELAIEDLPAQRWWDVEYLEKYSKGSVYRDQRSGAPTHHAWWVGDSAQAGSFVHAMQSQWLSEKLLLPSRLRDLSSALFDASRFRSVGLHFNKGLAGAPKAAISSALETAINPAVVESFALAIIGASGKAVYEGAVVGDCDRSKAQSEAQSARLAIAKLRDSSPSSGTYFAESDFFQTRWQSSFWGQNYERLSRAKIKYDPTGLFFINHGVGSENWSTDGFVPRVDA